MENLDKGIWIDEEKAWIASGKFEQTDFRSIDSGVETYHLHGGSGSSTPYGPQDTVSETGLLRRKKQQLKRYFLQVIKEILPVKRLYIIGPAEARTALEREIVQMNLPLKSIVVEVADKMTPNQFRARVRKFFKER